VAYFRQTKDIDGYTYHYDYENRLTQINKNDDADEVTAYTYDALGCRLNLSGANMKRNQLVLGFALVGLIFSLIISCQQRSATAQSAKNMTESHIKEIQGPEPTKVLPKLSSDVNNLSPKISFEKTVCDLGDVGQGTKNTCEFKFTNTGQDLLKVSGWEGRHNALRIS
jgi:hypothetical protein